MRLLLDTHIWIWSLTDPARIKPKVRAALVHRNARFVVVIDQRVGSVGSHSQGRQTATPEMDRSAQASHCAKHL